ncbi:endosomal/prevacuolar sodium/hydrogen exchanger [Acrasis kona]|uniref:Endosomal/prevacuolar sodium/hydrogen exchanger n=1 Tax=Acrasis kona TaxID=1008807 RepID=A0AAW2Z1E4_9EUKA
MIESEEEPPRWKSALSLVLIGSLIVLVFLIGKIVHRVRLLRLFVTESGLLLFIGFIVGLINHLTGNNFGDFLQFNTFLFDFIIIPIIIFESGYSLKKKVLYAVLGTLISALFIGFMLFVFAKYAGVDSVDVKTPIEALIFGSIISAIDPVASLAILSDVFGVKYKSDAPRLYTVIFGESCDYGNCYWLNFRFVL